MKKIVLLLLGALLPVLLFSQNKYTNKDVFDFKNGMLDAARKMSKSVPIQVNEFQTLIAIGVTETLVTYKYEIAGWNGNKMISKEELERTKSLSTINMMRSQQNPDMFLECLRRTMFGFQFMFFSEDRKYIGGFRMLYDDFKNIEY